jgi:hypothetical protein
MAASHSRNLSWIVVAATALALAIALLAPGSARGSAATGRGDDRGRKGPTLRAGISQRAQVRTSCRSVLMGKPRRRRAVARRRCLQREATTSTLAPSRLYWGASIGSQLTGGQAPWDMSAVDRFEGLAGKKLSLVNFFAPFANCAQPECYFYEFATGPMENIRQHGAIPVFSWSSQSIPSNISQPNFQLGDVIAGHYDAYIREFAEDARDWGHPFFLRFNWEMNGNWFPWSEGVNGNQPGEFVAAWRHVRDIFTAVGATNASWVWCPNIDPAGQMQSLDSLYPGDDYVDWTGLDGYNWGPGKGGWKSFDELYQSTYDHIVGSVAPSKPMLIGEMGSTERGGSKAAWISEALETIPTAYPLVRGMLWFDTFDDGMDWPIETSASAGGAFAAGIQNPAYVPNSYAELPASTIAPPS